jgi:hypothetical protein
MGEVTPVTWIDRAKFWILVICAFAAAVLGYRACDQRTQRQYQAAADRIGAVAINVGMSVRDLETIVRDRLRAGGVGGGEGVRNLVKRQFGDELITLWFFSRDSTVTNESKPIHFHVMPQFKGSICGVRTTDSREQAVLALRTACPNVELDSAWGWSLTFCGSKDRSHELCLTDTAYRIR